MKNSQTFFIRNKAIALPAMLLLLVVTVIANICIGTVSVSPARIVQIISGIEGDTVEASIVLFARLPRILAAILAGAALSVSGLIIQTVLDNPLAAPNIIGVNSGAGLMVILCSLVFPGRLSLLPFAAFAGALLAVLFVLFLAQKTGASRFTLLLAGVSVSTVLNALIDAVIEIAPDALLNYSDFRLGGLHGVSLEKIGAAPCLIVIGLLSAFLLSDRMELLQLGAETAHSLGLSVSFTRIILLTAAASLAGAAISFSGMIGFVGLIVPHIVRKLFGTEIRWQLAFCILGGAVFLLLCDLLARTIFSPYEISVSILLSLLGGPFFIGILFRQRGGRIHD